MNKTIQYSLWRVPVDEHATIPTEDDWLFAEPFHVFDLYSLPGHISRTIEKHGGQSIVEVGQAKIPSRLKLRARTAQFSNWYPLPTKFDKSATSNTSTATSNSKIN